MTNKTTNAVQRLMKPLLRRSYNSPQLAIAVILVVAIVGGTIIYKSHAAGAPPPPSGGYYQLTASGTPFKDEATCAAEVRARNNPWEPTPRPGYSSNDVANHTSNPNAGALAKDTADFDATWNSSYTTRVTGNFTGTTDEIFQWAACKWGWSDDLLRAEALHESNWEQAGLGDNESRSQGHCPWDITGDPCATSYGILQTKWYYHPPITAVGGLVPDSKSVNSSYGPTAAIRTSTAFEVDQFGSIIRGCYDGHSFFGSQAINDAWSCMGSIWYAGSWQQGGGDYVNNTSNGVKTYYNQKPWLSWPDKSTGTVTDNPPSVSLPTPPASVAGTVTISASASDDKGLTKVELYKGGALFGTVTAAPYNFTWNTTTGADGAYSFYAKAYDTGGHVTTSNTVTYNVVNGDKTPPTDPGSVTGTANSPTQITVNWTKATDNVGVTGYRVWRGITNNGSSVIATVSGTTLSYIDTTVSPSTSYYYAIQAVDAANNQSPGNVSTTVVTPATTDITAPTASLTAPASGATVSGSAVTVSATATDNVAVQRVDFLLDGAVISSDTSNPYSFNWNSLGTPDGSHTLKAIAYDTSGNPGSSSQITVTVKNNVTPPSGSSIRINSGGGAVTDAAGNAWSADVNASGGQTDNQASGHTIAGTTTPALYQDERYGAMTYSIPAANGSYLVRLHFAEIFSGCQKSACRVFNVDVNGTRFLSSFDIFGKVGGYTADIEQTSTTVTNGTLAINFGAITENPQIAAIEIIPVTTIAAPSNLTATAANATTVNLAWTASTTSGVTGYYVQRDGATIANVTGTSYSNTGLSQSTMYSYTVVAHDNAGNASAASNTASVKTPAQPDTTPPTTPTGLTATVISSTQINLSWGGSTDTGGSGLAGYQVWRNGLYVTTVTGTTFGDASLSANTAYSYYIVAIDGANNLSAHSNTATASTSPVSTSKTLTLTPSGDAIGNANYPNANYGSITGLLEDTNRAIFLKFNVSGIGTGTVTSAKLRLYDNNNGTSFGGYLRRQTSAGWNESTVTWNNPPKTDWSTKLATLGSVSANSWVEMDVTGYITSDNTYGFTLYNGSSDSANFSSKEAGSNAPQLIVTVK